MRRLEQRRRKAPAAPQKGVRSVLAGLLILVLTAASIATPLVAASKTTKGAAIGAGVGLLVDGGKGAAKGALVGAGTGALTEKGDKEKTKDYAKKGAAVGAGVGLLTGGGLEGAAKGAVYAGAAGAVVGNQKDKKN